MIHNTKLSFIKTNPDKIRSELKKLKELQGYILLLDIFYEASSGDLNYLLLNLEEHQRVMITLRNVSGRISSVYDLFSVAYSLESKISRQSPIVFVNEQGEDLVKKSFSSHSVESFNDYLANKFKKSTVLDYDHFAQQSWLNTSYENIFHARGILSGLSLSGDNIDEFVMEEGAYHYGLEDKLVNCKLEYLGKYLATSNESLGLYEEILINQMIEDAANVKISDRAQVIRMLLLELQRIYDHIVVILEMFKELSPKLLVKELFVIRRAYLFELQNLLGESFRSWSKKVDHEVFKHDNHFLFSLTAKLKVIEKQLLELLTPMVRNKFWMQKTCDVAHLSALSAISYGITGPDLRASGINYDLRRARPYYFYNDVHFQLPLGAHGNAYDRFIVRLEEIKQSFSIIYQLLENMPIQNSFYIDDVENPIESIKMDIKSYHALESSDGEKGFYLNYNLSEKRVESLRIRSGAASKIAFIKNDLVNKRYSEVVTYMCSLYFDAMEAHQ